jgi:hypothetical protein
LYPKTYQPLTIALAALIFTSHFPLSVWACAVQGPKLNEKQWASMKSKLKNQKNSFPRSPSALVKPPTLPSFSGSGPLVAWGSGNSKGFRPEAVMANAASKALNDGWSQADVKDVKVAIPTHFSDSGFHPYGDGQSNTAPDFHSAWGQDRPQLVATLMEFNSGKSKVQFQFDRTIQRDPKAAAPIEIEIYYMTNNGSPKRLKVPLKKNSAGDFIADWSEVPSDLQWSDAFQNKAVLVRPQPSFQDWFPIFFRLPVRSTDALIQAAPTGKNKFTGNLSSLTLVEPGTGKYKDPLGIGKASASASGPTPFQNLMNQKFPAGYNQIPYNPLNIHGEFGSGGSVTGVGQGWTWVAEDKQARPFKIMYTCFERRQPAAEASARDGGVASGGGWHSINNKTPGVDPDVPATGAAEIILNSLEREPLVVAGGYVNISARTNLPIPEGGAAYNLSDVAVFRWLQPGEGFITTAGISQPNHHWYFFQQNREVCTEEWVGQCGTDFACQ